MVAEYYDVLIRIQLLVGPGGDLSQGHEERIGQTGGLELPWFPHIEQKRCWLVALLQKGLGGDLRIKHVTRISSRERYTRRWEYLNSVYLMLQWDLVTRCAKPSLPAPAVPSLLSEWAVEKN